MCRPEGRHSLGSDHLTALTLAGHLAADLRALCEHHQARILDEDTSTCARRPDL